MRKSVYLLMLPMLLVALWATLACGGLSSKQKAAVEESLKSLKKVQAATEVGVTYQNYGPLLADAKAKINEASGVLPDGPVKEELNAAISAYADAVIVWGDKIKNGGGFSELGDSKPLTDKYKLRELAHPDKYGIYIADVVIKVIWADATQHLDAAEKAVKR